MADKEHPVAPTKSSFLLHLVVHLTAERGHGAGVEGYHRKMPDVKRRNGFPMYVNPNKARLVAKAVARRTLLRRGICRCAKCGGWAQEKTEC